jgi:NAD+ kinase
MPRSAILLVNSQKPAASAAAAEVRELIQRYGRLVAELVADNSPLPGAAREAELVVVFGGDGTLISQARRCALPGAAMLGVNLGRLGFLAEFDMTALREQGPAIFGGGELAIAEFPLIAVRVTSVGGEARFEGTALNEAVVTAGPPYRMITMAMSIDGQTGPTVSGDGFIVSTPLGSTAYNLSAGGPILAPLTDALAITPIAAHSLSVRPVVVPGNSRVELKAVRVNRSEDGASPGSHGTTLVLDGQVQVPISDGDRISIVRAERTVRFVQNPRSDYWSRLIGKLNWSMAPKLA